MTRSEFKTLAIQRILRLDGATGTELAKRGMPPGVCPEAWILDNPDAIIDVQRCYAAAGSDIVTVTLPFSSVMSNHPPLTCANRLIIGIP